jgi:hypothetical protein
MGALFAAGCGSSASGDPKVPPAQETVIGENGKPADAHAEGHKSLVEMKRDFMEGCSSKVPNAPDYCECGWEQMTKTFSEAEMNSSTEDKAKLGMLKERIEGTCKSKLPEVVVQQMFQKGCASDDPVRKPYCDCMWLELRKKFSSGEMTDDGLAKSDRFNAAKRGAVKVCGAKMPEEIARNGFFQGCQTEPARKPFCECAWKAVRGMASAAEIESGLLEPEAARVKIEKVCEKLRAK